MPFFNGFYKKNLVKYQPPYCGMNPKFIEDDNTLQFNALYESGNLDCVIKINNNEYDLFMRVDSNTRGHAHWFNFTVKNMKKG